MSLNGLRIGGQNPKTPLPKKDKIQLSLVLLSTVVLVSIAVGILWT
jgi:hypothetical protein